MATTDQMRLLRALYRQAHGVTGRIPKGGGGGASAHARSMRYATLRNQGFTDAQAQARMDGPWGRAYSAPYGQDATDKQILQWAMGQGYGVPGVSGVVRGMQANSQSRRAGGDEPTKLDRLLAEAQAAQNQAEMANEARYQQGLSLLQDSYNRNVGTLADAREAGRAAFEDYGDTQRALNEEKSDENLAQIKAELARRGLLNSTVWPAFMARGERDLALVQGSIDEQKALQQANYDARMAQAQAEMDRALTQDQARWIQARHDQGPDLRMIAELARQYGLGNQGRGFDRANVGGTGFGQRAVPMGGAPILAGANNALVNPMGAIGSLAPLLANHGPLRPNTYGSMIRWRQGGGGGSPSQPTLVAGAAGGGLGGMLAMNQAGGVPVPRNAPGSSAAAGNFAFFGGPLGVNPAGIAGGPLGGAALLGLRGNAPATGMTPIPEIPSEETVQRLSPLGATGRSSTGSGLQRSSYPPPRRSMDVPQYGLVEGLEELLTPGAHPDVTHAILRSFSGLVPGRPYPRRPYLRPSGATSDDNMVRTILRNFRRLVPGRSY